jgi:hypothetical protein
VAAASRNSRRALGLGLPSRGRSGVAGNWKARLIFSVVTFVVLYFAKGILIPLAVASLLAVIPLTDNSVITDLGRLSSSASGQRHYPSWLWFVSERRS